jgi:hypothetical protein
MRLALLIAGVGALSLIGAALGHGLGVFASGGAEAQAVGTPTPIPLAPPTAVVAGDTAPSTDVQPPATALPTSPAQVHSIPTAASPNSAPPASARPAQQQAGSASQPAKLPRTGGDDLAPATTLALALFAIGLALWVVPHAGFGRPDQKEKHR